MEGPCLAKRRPRDAMKRRGDLGSPWGSWAKSGSDSDGASEEASQKPKGLSFLSAKVQRLPRGLLLEIFYSLLGCSAEAPLAGCTVVTWLDRAAPASDLPALQLSF